MRIVLYNILYKCYLILVTLLIARKIKCSAVVLILFLSFASFHENTLHKKSPYSELFWSKFFPHFPAFGLITERYEVSPFIQSKCGKIREICGPE